MSLLLATSQPLTPAGSASCAACCVLPPSFLLARSQGRKDRSPVPPGCTATATSSSQESPAPNLQRHNVLKQLSPPLNNTRTQNANTQRSSLCTCSKQGPHPQPTLGHLGGGRGRPPAQAPTRMTPAPTTSTPPTLFIYWWGGGGVHRLHTRLLLVPHRDCQHEGVTPPRIHTLPCVPPAAPRVPPAASTTLRRRSKARTLARPATATRCGPTGSVSTAAAGHANPHMHCDVSCLRQAHGSRAGGRCWPASRQQDEEEAMHWGPSKGPGRLVPVECTQVHGRADVRLEGPWRVAPACCPSP